MIGYASYVTLRSFDCESAVPDNGKRSKSGRLSAQDDNGCLRVCRGAAAEWKTGETPFETQGKPALRNGRVAINKVRALGQIECRSR